MSADRSYDPSLEEMVATEDGRPFLLRPVKSDDGPIFIEMFDYLSHEDVRFRFFGAMPTLTPDHAARLTQIDYDREMAFVLTNLPGDPATANSTKTDPVPAEVYGVVRIILDPDGTSAQFAIMVRTDMKNHGLGLLLMRRMIAYSKARGLSKIHGDVMRENKHMLHFCAALGFARQTMAGKPDIIEVELDLQAPEPTR